MVSVIWCLVIGTCKNVYDDFYTFHRNQIQMMLQIVALIEKNELYCMEF